MSWSILIRGGFLAMAIACNPTISLAYSGDRSQNYQFTAASVSDRSPDAELVVGLASGDNTISVPTSGVLARGVVMIPPPTNTAVLKLKGAGGDTGVNLSRTDPTALGLDSGVTSFIINASAAVAGVRFRIW